MFWRKPPEPPAPRSVRLHLRDDPRTVEGILTHVDAEHYYLEHARLLMSTLRDQDVPFDGRTWWPRKDVLCVQELLAVASS